MCASPSEKPLCFSCLSVCIVVQGKRHTQFPLRRFSIWRCPLYFYWLVYGWPLHTLYERGILRLYIWKTLGNLRTAWVHDVSIVSQCLFSISSHRTKEQSVGRFQQVHWLECTRLGHRYHRGALPLPGLGIFPTGMGQISFAFLHFVVWKVFFFISLTRIE